MNKIKQKNTSIPEFHVRNRCEELGLVYVRQYTEKNKTRVVYLCPNHLEKGEIGSLWTHLRTAKRGCPYCSGKYKTTKDFVSEVAAILPDVDVLGEYKTSRTKVEVKCTKCGNEWSPEVRSLLYGQGCPICAKQKRADARRKTQVDFEFEISSVSPNIVVCGEYIGTHKKVKCMCVIHENTWESYPANLLNGSAGCPMCASEKINNSPSRGERRIMNWLDDNGIKYESECVLNGCSYKRPLRFDFYLPKLNMAIEYDGEQHFSPVGWYANNITSFSSMRIRDSIKNNYCNEHGIHLLRIPYTDYDNIENILNKQIKEDI